MKFTLLAFLLFSLLGCEQPSRRGTKPPPTNPTTRAELKTRRSTTANLNTRPTTDKIKDLIYLEELAKIEESPQPILVYMHGYGDNERGPLVFSKSLNERFFVVSMRAPIDLGRDRYAWFGPQGSAKEDVVNMHARRVIQTIKGLPRTAFEQGSGNDKTKRAPLYLAGFSQGARMAIEVAKRADPGLIQGAIAFSPATFKAGKVKVPLWISHGRQDKVVAFGPIQNAVSELKASGAKVHFEIFEGQHSIPAKTQRKARLWIADALNH